MHLHLQPVDPLAGGDEQQVLVFAAKADVAGPRFAHVDVLDLLSLPVEHGHAVAGEIDVARVVDRHAVGAHLAEQPLAVQRAVGLDVVGVGLAAADIGHVEGLAVGRADDAVGLLQDRRQPASASCDPGQDSRRLRSRSPSGRRFQ